MDVLIGLVVMYGVARWCYRQGKSTGSRQGYHIGRSRRR